MMNKNTTISACLIVKDAEKMITNCLDSLRAAVDEMIVVDFSENPLTGQTAKAAGAQVIPGVFENNYSDLKNLALERAKGEWILMIQPDEQLDMGDYQSLRAPLSDTDKIGFVCTHIRQSERGQEKTLQLRLFRNLPEIRYSGLVYERVDPSIAALFGDFEGVIGTHPACFYTQEKRMAKKSHLKLLKDQIRLDPEDPYYLYKLASHPLQCELDAYERKNALTQAWELLRIRDPKGVIFSYTADVAASLILHLFLENRINAAFTIACEAGELAWFSPNLHYALAQCAISSNNLNSAEAYLKAALAEKETVTPNPVWPGILGPLSLSALSEIRYLQGDREGAEDLYLEALQLDKSAPNSFFSPVEEVLSNNLYLRALLFLKIAAENLPEATEPWIRGSEILMGLGEHQKCLEWLRIAVARASKDEDQFELMERLDDAHLKLYAK